MPDGGGCFKLRSAQEVGQGGVIAAGGKVERGEPSLLSVCARAGGERGGFESRHMPEQRGMLQEY